MANAASLTDAVTARMRAMALAADEGALLGSEQDMQERMGVSRPTVRQAARILEREGLVVVRRGQSGGYFAARPGAAFVEATVASYLEALHARPDDLTNVATALWVEAVAKAARLSRQDAVATTIDAKLHRKLRAIDEQSGFQDVMAIETTVRRAIFDLIDSPYIELIFNINANFARRRAGQAPAANDGTPMHMAFVLAWRQAMTLQLSAIADGDAEVAVLAAKRCRELIHGRVWT